MYKVKFALFLIIFSHSINSLLQFSKSLELLMGMGWGDSVCDKHGHGEAWWSSLQFGYFLSHVASKWWYAEDEGKKVWTGTTKWSIELWTVVQCTLTPIPFFLKKYVGKLTKEKFRRLGREYFPWIFIFWLEAKFFQVLFVAGLFIQPFSRSTVLLVSTSFWPMKLVRSQIENLSMPSSFDKRYQLEKEHCFQIQNMDFDLCSDLGNWTAGKEKYCNGEE